MKANRYIKERQRLWAARRQIELTGSKGERGEERYTATLDQNLFEPLSHDATKQIEGGDGNELACPPNCSSKMQAVHSSSALGVNFFHYWQRIGDVRAIAKACKLPGTHAERICFECKWSISDKFRFAPNIDVVIFNSDRSAQKVSAIECKFNEAYCGREHGGLDEKYLQLDGGLWADLPALRKFAESISPADRDYQHLHPSQLVKHILGLKRAFGRRGFRLLYLWYDVPGEEGARHRREVDRFTKIANADHLYFHSLTYQELILRLANQVRAGHQPYVDYLSERYL